jgi:hypothetical protein
MTVVVRLQEQVMEKSYVEDFRQEYESCVKYLQETSSSHDLLTNNLNFNLRYVDHHEKFFSGRRQIDIGHCNFLTSHHRHYIFPLLPSHQSKATFLPDLLKIAKGSDCHLIVLIDGVHHWSNELSTLEEDMITVDDASLNVHVESECSDSDGQCVLTWMRLPPEGGPTPYDVSITYLSNGYEQPTPILEEKEAYGYRCAMLRITDWKPDELPEAMQWGLIEGLYRRCSFSSLFTIHYLSAEPSRRSKWRITLTEHSWSM